MASARRELRLLQERGGGHGNRGGAGLQRQGEEGGLLQAGAAADLEGPAVDLPPEREAGLRAREEPLGRVRDAGRVAQLRRRGSEVTGSRCCNSSSAGCWD